jgi:hypothetical protein
VKTKAMNQIIKLTLLSALGLLCGVFCGGIPVFGYGGGAAFCGLMAVIIEVRLNKTHATHSPSGFMPSAFARTGICAFA